MQLYHDTITIYPKSFGIQHNAFPWVTLGPAPGPGPYARTHPESFGLKHNMFPCVNLRPGPGSWALGRSKDLRSRPWARTQPKSYGLKHNTLQHFTVSTFQHLDISTFASCTKSPQHFNITTFQQLESWQCWIFECWTCVLRKRLKGWNVEVESMALRNV